MSEPTTSELLRIVQQMADDGKEYRQDMKATISAMVQDVRELKENTGEIKIQTIKTNGGLVMLKSDFYGDEGKTGALSTISDLKSRERYVAGAIFVCFGLFAVVPFFLNLYIRDTVSTAMAQVRPSNVDVTNINK